MSRYYKLIYWRTCIRHRIRGIQLEENENFFLTQYRGVTLFPGNGRSEVTKNIGWCHFSDPKNRSGGVTSYYEAFPRIWVYGSAIVHIYIYTHIHTRTMHPTLVSLAAQRLR